MQKQVVDICALLAKPYTNQARLNGTALRGTKVHAASLSKPSYFGARECNILKSRVVGQQSAGNTISIAGNALLITTCAKVTQRQPVAFEITVNIDNSGLKNISKTHGFISMDTFLGENSIDAITIETVELKLGLYQIDISSHIYTINKDEEAQLCELLLSDQSDMQKAWHFEDLFDKIDEHLLHDGSRYAELLRQYQLAAIRLNGLFKPELGYKVFLVDKHTDKISANPQLYSTP